MNNYEQCLTTENDGGFIYNFFMLAVIFGFSVTMASMFVAKHTYGNQ